MKKRRHGDKVVGVLGCMAERVKEKLLENRVVDLVAGPDAYRDLPRLLKILESDRGDGEGSHEMPINVQLSQEETYADIIPMRVN